MRSSRPSRRTSARTLLHPDSFFPFFFLLVSVSFLSPGFSLFVSFFLSSLSFLSYSGLARCHSYYSCPILFSPLCCVPYFRLPFCTASSSRFASSLLLYRLFRPCFPHSALFARRSSPHSASPVDLFMTPSPRYILICAYACFAPSFLFLYRLDPRPLGLLLYRYKDPALE